MSNFNWITFLTTHGVEYVERGPNVARGNVNIHCPYCGESDPSHHLGISLDGKGWGCWRNTAHRGRQPQRLIQALLSCSYEEAESLVESEGRSLAADDELSGQVASMLSEINTDVTQPTLFWPREIKPLVRGGEYAHLFFAYLRERGYDKYEVEKLVQLYGLRYAYRGAFSNRIVLPVITQDGLVNWTGRSIEKRAVVRYKSLSTDKNKAEDEGLPPARRSIKATLWNQGELADTRAKVLVVCEGPLDALRVDFYGRSVLARATCLFSKGLTDEQLLALSEIRENFNHAVLLLDDDPWGLKLSNCQKE
jgi:hypothetical protein